MNTVFANFKIQINSKIYVKNPETSDLGRKILEQSIILIDEIGFDNFTFKSLEKNRFKRKFNISLL